jgi:hypothetical protein
MEGQIYMDKWRINRNRMDKQKNMKYNENSGKTK